MLARFRVLPPEPTGSIDEVDHLVARMDRQGMMRETGSGPNIIGHGACVLQLPIGCVGQ